MILKVNHELAFHLNDNHPPRIAQKLIEKDFEKVEFINGTPNPTNNLIKFTIDSNEEISTYSVINSSGAEIISKHMCDECSEIILNVQGYKNGLYTLLLHSENDLVIQVSRFIVNK